MSNYDNFRRVFSTTTSKVLAVTISNSQARFNKFEAAGNALSAQVEIDRIQAAADILDERGYYNNRPLAKTAVTATGIGLTKGAVMFAGLALAAVLLS